MRRPGTGDTLEGFRLGEVVHAGAYAVLHAATHPDHPGPILVKLPLLQSTDPAAVVSFEMEQMILPRLSGRHVPRVLGLGDFAADPFIAMERIPGPNLAARAPDLPLPPDEVAEIGAKVATALADIHRQRVSHLDVKPANILFREDGTAVLVDYGLAHHGDLPDLLAEEIRLPLGTAPYMAPRQTLGLRDDPRSDLFALGVVMYEMATGVLPYGNPQHLRAARRRLWRDPVPPRRLRPEIPPALQEIILRCLEPDPADRHPGAGALAFDLRNGAGVRLTARATRTQRDPWLKAIQRRVNLDTSPARAKPADTAHSAPIVVIALDLADTSPELATALRRSLGNVIAARPGARVACVNVIVQALLGGDAPLDEEGRSVRVQRLVEMRHWAAPLGLTEGRITFHVLEGPSAADAIVDYAAANAADHLVVGARTEGVFRKRLGPVAAEVITNAPCSITVVRPRH